jgi:carboxylate-amine ligase
MCDGVATRAELQAICALVHLLADWFDQNKEDSAKALGAPPERWILRENKWRAIRYGTQAKFIDEMSRNVMNMNQWLSDWRKKCEGLIRELHYTSEFELLDEMIVRGNSSERQTRLLKISPGGILNEEDELRLMQFNVEEFTSGLPNWGYA